MAPLGTARTEIALLRDRAETATTTIRESESGRGFLAVSATPRGEAVRLEESASEASHAKLVSWISKIWSRVRSRFSLGVQLTRAQVRSCRMLMLSRRVHTSKIWRRKKNGAKASA